MWGEIHRVQILKKKNNDKIEIQHNRQTIDIVYIYTDIDICVCIYIYMEKWKKGKER